MTAEETKVDYKLCSECTEEYCTLLNSPSAIKEMKEEKLGPGFEPGNSSFAD